MLRSLVMIGLLIAIPVLAGAEELPPIPAPTPLSPAEERAIEKNQPRPGVEPIKPVPPETLKRLESARNQYRNQSCESMPTYIPIITPQSSPEDTAKYEWFMKCRAGGCGKEGDTHSAMPGSYGCCKGYSSVYSGQHSAFLQHHNCVESQKVIAPPGASTICVACGDGICKEPEDSCNCPADCKK